MCGIFGQIVFGNVELSPKSILSGFRTLASLSESRGRDSSGIIVNAAETDQWSIYKGPVTLATLFKRQDVTKVLAKAATLSGDSEKSFVALGHSRLVTNGSNSFNENNQPVQKKGVAVIHNGIIVNHAKLWEKLPLSKRELEVDTEILPELIRHYIAGGKSPSEAVISAVGDAQGTVSCASVYEDFAELVLASNNRSLYYLTDSSGYFAFASERYFLENMQENLRHQGVSGAEIFQIHPGEAVAVNLSQFQLTVTRTEAAPTDNPSSLRKNNSSFKVTNVGSDHPQLELVLDPAALTLQAEAKENIKHLEHNCDRINNIRRCRRCILPATFPFIDFDEKGVCNYCRNYRLKNQKDSAKIEEFLQVIEAYKRPNGENDCIIPYSGGRDSTHTLHIAKKELGLNPIAFTYDWGMVTDLARRNIARVCGKLGVENIIVSADIAWKRENIRKNITAWLKKPHLGMAPLFMAGDKYFFYYTDKVRKQTGLDLNIWGTNPLENTDFKVGFLGVPPDFEKKRIYSLSMGRKFKLAGSVANIMAHNPAYLNGSIWDTFGSFISRSLTKRSHYYHLYDYFHWDEHEVEDLVLNEYDWEIAIDTDTTWRIGDGTAAFYNYIYYTVAGFSEYDTFRSNQIREGAMTREAALKIVEKENGPRYASLKWYLDIVGVDFRDAITTINSIPKLYD